MIGVKSTALKFGEDTKKWLSGFGFGCFAGLITTGLITDQTWPYFLGAAGIIECEEVYCTLHFSSPRINPIILYSNFYMITISHLIVQ